MLLPFTEEEAEEFGKGWEIRLRPKYIPRSD